MRIKPIKISIITATYNSGQTIKACLESVNAQTYPHIEHIIVDGRSSDSTLDIIHSNPTEKARFVISEPDAGIYDALNKGISRATGEVIGFLHSDDIFASPDTITEIDNLFKQTGADVIYGDLEYVSKGSPDKVLRNWQSRPFSPEILDQGWMPPHPTVFMKKTVYNRLGAFDIKYKISADYDHLLRVFANQQLKFQYLPKVITKMKIGGISNRNLFNILRKSREDYLILRSHGFTTPVKTLLFKNLSKINQLRLRLK